MPVVPVDDPAPVELEEPLFVPDPLLPVGPVEEPLFMPELGVTLEPDVPEVDGVGVGLGILGLLLPRVPSLLQPMRIKDVRMTAKAAAFRERREENFIMAMYWV